MTAIGHIYKIICLVDSKFCYIGSTFNTLNERFQQHRDSFIKWLKNERTGMSCFPFYEKYGIEKFKIILIKSYEVCKTHCKDSKHLRAYETLWINKTKCCNLLLPINYLKKQKIQWFNKEYFQNNKEAIYKQQKQYQQDNKEAISERNKQYRQDNKKKISEQKKQYRQNNKEEIAKKSAIKITCECGCILVKRSLTRHKKSKKHIDLMKQK
jgi:hypothetical protein